MAGLGAAIDPTDPIDPHDGCPKCGGGGSARYLGTDGKPISATTVRRLACEADLIPVVLGGDGQVLDLGRSDRFFQEHQRRALAIRDGSHCHFPGCQIPEPRCITHHMTAWDDGGPTDLANGVLLCRYHHTTVHHKGWHVRMGTHGHPEYVPPEWTDPQRRILRP
ncbi:HNH endonuclease signature motif containing protein [Actinopolymorpha rutila]|uniref:HNH endonuclease signature motif containing protein n=1 Tax=Actinopolymorpha rutila TaxID=446787 RepID=UPI00307F87BE